MSAVPLTRMMMLGFLAHLLLFSFLPLSVCMELSEDAENLKPFNSPEKRFQQWATGPFMGKRSLQDMYNLIEQDIESDLMPPKTMERMKDTYLREQHRTLSPSQQQSAQWILKKMMEHYLKAYKK
ncbi:hypothetical protein GDO86_006105 [Hymenochirus boettgeri]|uniref:Uncharacterized protein n=1 Tax=Hymenochirus boettgeri TaxID=247094 RepID=A0A8T2J9N6_9PIPI|nr:hypothetical protein GDO86_006105 [Hymenochirus boettgeri]